MRRARLETYAEPAARPHARCCDHAGCAAAGDFRAPRSRATLNEYFWFCLDHVREYNAAWNYYLGMNETEIEREIRNDTTWQRPTWPLGSRHARMNAKFHDDIGIFSDEEPAPRRETPRQRELSETERALAVFGVEPPFTLVRLKSRYKELVKLNHPDAHGGDKAAEERLKIINQAYSTLKVRYFS